MPRYAAGGEGPLDPDRSRLYYVDSYGAGGFRIGGEAHAGSVIVLPDRVLAWAVAAFADVTVASLQPLFDAAAEAGTDLLLLGGGARMQMTPPDLRRACNAAGITVEPMDTGAAARTYNVLLAEDRHVAAALIAV